MKNQKGTITVLGSDLPALIPLVVGLVLFFGMLGYGMNTVTARNSQMDVERLALQLGDIVRTDGIITKGQLEDQGDLGEVCQKMQTVRGTFVAGVLKQKYLDNLAEPTVGAMSINFDEMCASKNLLVSNSTNLTNEAKNIDLNQKFARITYIYPTIYQDPDAELGQGLTPEYIAVIVWR